MGKSPGRLFVLILACILLGPATTPAQAQAPRIASLSDTALAHSDRLSIFGSDFGSEQAPGGAGADRRVRSSRSSIFVGARTLSRRLYGNPFFSVL